MKSVENAGNIKENSDSILEKLEYLVKQGRDGFTDEILAELREQAKSEFDSKTLNLTKEATKEAENKFFDPKTYKEILGYLKNSNSKVPIDRIVGKYNVGKIDLEKFFKERSSAKLASAYSSYKSYIDIEKLLLMNPGGKYLEEEYSEHMESKSDIEELESKAPDTRIVTSKATFIHELFSNSVPREDIISIFKKLNE